MAYRLIFFKIFWFNDDVTRFSCIVIHNIHALYFLICLHFPSCFFYSYVPTSTHLYRLQNAMHCTRMSGRFMLLKMGKNLKQWFFCEMYFQNNLVLDFGIYTMISTKNLHSQYPILHQSSKLYYWAREACTIMTTKNKRR